MANGYYIAAGFVVGAGVFFLLFYERIEHALFIEKAKREIAESKLREFTDGLPEAQVSDEGMGESCREDEVMVHKDKPASYRILQAVLGFLCAPLHHSLWFIAVIAMWIGFGGFVFLFASVGMMLDLGGELVGACLTIAVGASAIWMTWEMLGK